MRKLTKSELEENPALSQEFPARLAELEAEIRHYPSRSAGERALKSIEDPVGMALGEEQVVQFRLRKKVYAAGHTDVTYRDSNHARGVRHIRFYAEGQIVLDIEGDYEDQQLGSNFRFQNIQIYVPGTWETDFVKLTDDFRQYRTKRSDAVKKKRNAERARLHR